MHYTRWCMVSTAVGQGCRKHAVYYMARNIGSPKFVSEQMKVGGFSIGNYNVGCWDVIIENTPP